MIVTFERIYYADVTPADPGFALRTQAEKHIPHLLPSRRHVFYTVDGRTLSRECLTSICWRVTYTPDPAAV